MATINGTAGNDTLTGTDVDSTGNGGDDTIHGLAGNDTIDGLGGSNQLFGDDGDDVFHVALATAPTSPTHSAVDGGAGYDTLDLSGSNGLFDIEEAGAGSFKVTQDNVAILTSVTGVEQIDLGDAAGNSGTLLRLADWTTDLKIIAHGAFNAITTGLGNDTIIGDDGNDVMNTVGGNDSLSGGAGEDQAVIAGVSGHADHVTIDGGAGTDDLLIYSPALQNAGATIDLAAGTGSVGPLTLSIANVENVYLDGSSYVSVVYGDDGANQIRATTTTLGSMTFDGRGGDDHVTGGNSGDHLAGGDGNDTIDGLGANDVVQGGAGDDVLYGGNGNNNLDGGDGNDWIDGGGQDPATLYSASVTSGSDTIIGGNGADHIWGADQSVHAGAPDGADSISAGDGNDYVNGNAGADTIDGGAGNDRLRGGQGDDQIFGGDGNDIIQGDAGNDTLHGGAGYDVLTGGPGADTFAFSVYGPLSLSEASFDSAGHTDVITDFEDGVDKIALGFTPAAVLTGTAATFSAAETAAQAMFDNHAGDHEVGAMQVGADTYLFFSGTGGGDIYAAVKLAGIQATLIDTGDFV